MSLKSLISLVLTAVLYFALLISFEPRPAGAQNFNVNADVVNAMRLIQENAASIASDQACSRSILNDVTYQITRGSGNSVITIKLTNHEEHIIHGLVKYFTITCNNQKWGVWIFRCGQFINRGEMGWENWAMTGPCFHRFHRMHGVHFETEDCPSTEWRDTQKCK